MKSSTHATLMCHPATPTLLVRRIEVIVRKAKTGVIGLTYVLEADLTSLRIPPPGAPSRADDLWLHTCFEAFVMVNDGPEYVEFNFAPSGEWAIYQFSRYRERVLRTDEPRIPTIKVRKSERRLELDATTHLPEQMAAPSSSRLRLGLCAVVEDAGGALSYWAVRHRADRPDFHDADGFTLEIGS